MHNNLHIALLLFAWVSTGLTTFVALDAATRLLGDSTITKCRNRRTACAVILDIGLWSGLWLGQFGLHRQVGMAVPAPIVATLMTALAVSLAAFSIVSPETSASNDAPAPQQRSIAMGAVVLGTGLLTVGLYPTCPWAYDQALSLRRAVLGWGGGTLMLGAGVHLVMCMAFRMPPAQRRAAVGLRACAAAVLATTAVLSLVLWPCVAAWPADESTMHIMPVIMLSTGGVLIVSGLYAVLMMLETRVDSAQTHLEVSLACVANQTPQLQLYDALTGPPNRLYLREALEAAIPPSTRRGHSFAPFYLDLDNLGQINDQYGRNAGNRVLQIIAERLRQAIRGKDIVACLGGGEFGTLVEGLALSGAATTTDDKLLFHLRESVKVEGRRLCATASIGVVVHPRNSATADTLFKHTDTAMFDCEQPTGNAYRFFELCLNTTAHHVLQIRHVFSHAALNGQLLVYYQLKYDARTQAMTGAEVPLRWNHLELGPVSPAEFIPLVERTGIIVELGDWVVEEACRQIMHWGAIGMASQRIAVNLSPRQFQQPNLVQRLSQILHRYQVAAHRLMLRITEIAAVRDASQSIVVVHQIQSLGFEAAIDDFGTGYSSFSCLQRFCAQQIRINHASVSALDDNPSEAAAIIRAICAMAHSLDMIVVAEGVETEVQMQASANLQCDQVRGYLSARPMLAKDFQGSFGVEYA